MFCVCRWLVETIVWHINLFDLYVITFWRGLHCDSGENYFEPCITSNILYKPDLSCWDQLER